MLTIDELSLGTVPSDEDCVQVRAEGGYAEPMMQECRRYVEMLRNRFPGLPPSNRFKITRNPHDFGTYCDVVITFDTSDKVSTNIACFIEDNLPTTWEDKEVLSIETISNLLEGKTHD